MPDRFLNSRSIAAMLDTSPGVAASILAEQGVHPIDFGYGRGRGRRWLESAVLAALHKMHEAAQPKPRQPRTPKRPSMPSASLAGMSASAVFEMLTNGQCVQ